MTAYYNEIDPFAAQWLRNLIAAGHITPGEVDERSIEDIVPDDLRAFKQCHFFAGIGIWSYALRRAGWVDDRPIWTGSCPCQPFSAAGKGVGFADERHLWPAWHHLIIQCAPSIVVGEQVASKDGLGWLDLVSTDMEGTGYAFAAADLCAAGFDGAHIRQRLYWMAYANGGQLGDARTQCGGKYGQQQANGSPMRQGYSGSRFDPIRLADDDAGSQGRGGAKRDRVGPDGQNAACGPIDGMDNPAGARRNGPIERAKGNPRVEARLRLSSERHGQNRSGPTDAPMLGRTPVDWLFCRDGKWRPVEPGTFPLADAPASRVGRLRAYGNGLDAETATQFIAAVMECCP